LGSDDAPRIEMNTLVADQVASFTAVIEQAGVPALRVAFTVAVVASPELASSSFKSGTNFSIAIQTSRTTSQLSATIESRKSFLSGAA
jgi:hypothetical protein